MPKAATPLAHSHVCACLLWCTGVHLTAIFCSSPPVHPHCRPFPPPRYELSMFVLSVSPPSRLGTSSSATGKSTARSGSGPNIAAAFSASADPPRPPARYLRASPQTLRNMQRNCPGLTSQAVQLAGRAGRQAVREGGRRHW